MISLIDSLRKAIDEIDEEILNLLSKRKDFVKEIAKLKESLDLPVFDKKREQEIIGNLSKKAKQFGLDADSVYKIFGSIFQISRNEQQKNMKIRCDAKKLGLIGFGRFGKLIVRHLSDDFEFHVYNRTDKSREIRQNKAIPASLEEACQNDIVMLAVPISEMENALKSTKNLLKNNSIVIDVCSVKEYPVKLMKEVLPKKIQILATHPMFGPDSAAELLEGNKIALCRIRVNDERYEKIKSYLKEKGLIVIETTPEKHDMETAKSLILTHFIGRALIEFGAKNMEIDTEGYKRLMKILDTVKNDTTQLFEDMNKYNKYSKETRDDFIKALNSINRRLEK